MSKTLSPLNDFVVVRRNNATETTESGIVLPGQAAEQSNIGTVVASGPGKYESGVLRSTGVNPGDTVMFNSDYARSIKFNGEELLVLQAEDLVSRVIGE